MFNVPASLRYLVKELMLTPLLLMSAEKPQIVQPAIALSDREGTILDIVELHAKAAQAAIRQQFSKRWFPE